MRNAKNNNFMCRHHRVIYTIFFSFADLSKTHSTCLTKKSIRKWIKRFWEFPRKIKVEGSKRLIFDSCSLWHLQLWHYPSSTIQLKIYLDQHETHRNIFTKLFSLLYILVYQTPQIISKLLFVKCWKSSPEKTFF